MIWRTRERKNKFMTKVDYEVAKEINEIMGWKNESRKTHRKRIKEME
jgi:hypothetical protein